MVQWVCVLNLLFFHTNHIYPLGFLIFVTQLKVLHYLASRLVINTLNINFLISRCEKQIYITKDKCMKKVKLEKNSSSINNIWAAWEEYITQ